MARASSFYWYDLETFGRHPAHDRIVQFAGQRTDLDLNPQGPPTVLYCKPARDYLPDPGACLVTGITPQDAQMGLPEAEFAAQIHAQLAEPGTCTVGYNSIRFDDEFLRHLFYRNLIEPYSREYLYGNSRWDLLDIARATRALRPDGINWPFTEDNKATVKLERLSLANGLEHSQAHDALSDVNATIALARLLRDTQPKLFHYALGLRDKRTVRKMLQRTQGQLLVHVSGHLPAAHGHCALVTPLCTLPQQPNAVLVADLGQDPSVWLDLDSQTLTERLFTPAKDQPSVLRPAIKAIHINRCPFIAPLGVLDGPTTARLGLDPQQAQEFLAKLTNFDPAILIEAFSRKDKASPDIDDALYTAFLPETDRRLLAAERTQILHHSDNTSPFTDSRLNGLLFRCKGRSFEARLSPQAQRHWQAFCRARLLGQNGACARTIDEYKTALTAAFAEVKDQEGQAVLQRLQQYSEQLLTDLALVTP